MWNGYEDISDEVQLKTSRHSLSGELGEEERKSHQAKKLQHLLGASEEQRLESAVDR